MSAKMKQASFEWETERTSLLERAASLEAVCRKYETKFEPQAYGAGDDSEMSLDELRQQNMEQANILRVLKEEIDREREVQQVLLQQGDCALTFQELARKHELNLESLRNRHSNESGSLSKKMEEVEKRAAALGR